MELNFRFSFLFSFFMISSVLVYFLLHGFSTATYISDDASDSHGYTGRRLLQIKKRCPLNFEFLNYTMITSQCKGPKYPPGRCCSEFKKLACPYSNEINDLKSDCATVLFNYIYLNGHYPPGIFASECREGKQGLDCSNFSSPNTRAADSNNAGPSPIACTSFSLLSSLITGFIIPLFLL